MKYIQEENTARDSGIPLAGAHSDFHDRTFSEEIDRLRHIVPQVFHLFHWFGATRRDEQLCTVEYLGHMLCRSLSSVRRLLSLRSQGLNDERCPEFETIIANVNAIVISMEQFTERADDLFRNELHCHDALQALLQRSHDDLGWLSSLSRDERLAAIVHRKCERMNFRLDTRMLFLPANGFRQLAYAVMFGLMLLTIPSQTLATTDQLSALYANSLQAYCRSEEAQQVLLAFRDQIDDMKLINHVHTREHELTFLSGLKVSRKSKIKAFLAPFGITYSITPNKRSVTLLAHQLYVHLNADDDSHLKKMGDADLATYFRHEMKLREVMDQIAALKTVCNDPTPPPDPKGFFKNNVHRSRMRRAIASTLNERKGDHCHVMGAQCHWLAIYRVLETEGLSQGTMKDFSDLMNTGGWFPQADPPCVYKSMKSVPAIDVKTKHYREWNAQRDRRNAPFKLVADTLLKYLEEQDFV